MPNRPTHHATHSGRGEYPRAARHALARDAGRVAGDRRVPGAVFARRWPACRQSPVRWCAASTCCKRFWSAMKLCASGLPARRGRALALRAVIVAVAAGILLVACAAGWICLRGARLTERFTALEQFVFSAGIGLNLVSLLTLGLGLCGAMHRGVFVAIGAAVVRIRRWLWVATTRGAASTSPGKAGGFVRACCLRARRLWC